MDKKEQARVRKQRQRDKEKRNVTQNVTLYQGNEVSVWWGMAMANANRANETKLGQGLTPEKLKSLEKLVKGG